MDQGECKKCLGSGAVADSFDQEPWPKWRDHSDYWVQRVVALGLVTPMPCPECVGGGEHRVNTEDFTVSEDFKK